ncbi:MAG: hypothetical protein ABFC77_14290, partial [Thermoguttaceae bacterium]
MLSPLISILTLVALAVAAFGFGRPLWRWIGSDDDALAAVLFSVGLGLVAVGLLLLGLGAFGMLSPAAIGVATMLGCCWGLVEIAFWCIPNAEPADDSSDPSERSPWSSGPVDRWPPPSAWWSAVVLGAATVVVAASLIDALTPPTADDAAFASLESAKRCLLEGRLVGPTRLVDAWHCWTLAFDADGVCARLVHWGVGLLFLLTSVVLASPLVGRRRAWLVAGLVALTPAINGQMGSLACGLTLAAMCVLAMTAWWQAVLHGGDHRWFVAAGLTAGAALAVDGAALWLIAALAVTWSWAVAGRSEQRNLLLRGAAVFALAALGVALPAGIGAGEGLSFSWAMRRVEWLGLSGLSASAWSEHLGLVALAALPAVFWMRRLRGLGVVLSVAAVYVAAVVLLANDARLLFPAVPLFAAAAVWVMAEMRRLPRRAQWIAASALGLMLACQWTDSVVRSFEGPAAALGLEDREDYLLRREPVYQAAAIANRVLRPDARLLSQDARTFYFNCRVTCETSLPRPIAANGSDAARRLCDDGFTHVLLVDNESDG